MIVRISTPRIAVMGTLFVFATAFAPLVGADQRNYLVIAVSAAMASALFALGVAAGDLAWAATAFLIPLMTLAMGGSEVATVGYTLLLACAYFAVAGGLRRPFILRMEVAALLRRIIVLFAVVSVMQMAASLAGLPVPNEILSKGRWSYNSVAAEPSHAGRALAMTFLCYIHLVTGGRAATARELLGTHRRVLLALVASSLLTGSVVAISAAPLAVLLALGWRPTVIALGLLAVIGPSALLIVDYEPLQRFVRFVIALPSLDLTALLVADVSGMARVAPLIIYMNHASPFDPGFWVGEGGTEAIASYLRTFVLGLGDVTASGFVPGYVVAFGAIGTALFLLAFLARFTTRGTSRLALLWVVLFSFSGWNTQLFWYGLMLLRVAWHFDRRPPAQPHAAWSAPAEPIPSGPSR